MSKRIILVLLIASSSLILTVGVAPQLDKDVHSTLRTIAPDHYPQAQNYPSKPLASSASAPITNRFGDQIFTDIAYNDDTGEYLVVWQDEDTRLDYDIYARRVGSDGATIGNEFVIYESSGLELDPAVTYKATTNEFLVVWQHEYSATDSDIYGQLVADEGSLIGSAFAIAWTADVEGNPEVVAFNPSVNEYLVVWQVREYSSEQNDVYGRRVRADGVVTGSPIAIAVDDADQSAPAVDSGEIYLVVWQEENLERVEYDIHARGVGPDGSLVGSETSVSIWEYDQLKPRVAYNNIDNEFLVVWEDHHWGWGDNWDIYGHRMNGAGTPINSQFGVSWELNHHENPDVVFKAIANEYLVVWEYEHSASDHDIYRRRVANDGTLLEEVMAVSNRVTHERKPTVSTDDAWGYLVVWEDERDSATQGVNLYGDVVQLYQLSGYVYDGIIGDESSPVGGVTIELYCSNSVGNMGTLIASTITDNAGRYGVSTSVVCEFYNIKEVDPSGYVSVGSTTVGGTVINSNWIQYTYPLASKTLTGNKFWDQPETPEDTLPPDNWTNFTPAEWVNTLTVTSTVQVEDTGTGLDISTAKYAYSTDGGSSWSDWLPASCTGSDRTTSPQTITATNIPFMQDAGPTDWNLVKFRIADTAGNIGESGSYGVDIDTVPPQNPSTLFSATHDPATWSTLNKVTCQWSGAWDDRSGLAGYSYIWDHSPSTVTNATADTTAVVVTSHSLSDGNDWYFHTRSVDNAANGAVGAVHHGPYYIDTTPPESWVLPMDAWQEDIYIDVSWIGDPGSGSPIVSYDVKVVDQYEGNVTVIDWLVDTTWTSTTFTGERGHTYYFSSRSRDLAGNQEIYPTIADAITTVGRDVTISVKRENGANVEGAKVYHNDKYLGLTNSAGTIAVNDALMGDKLAALYQVYEDPTTKGHHGRDGTGNWAWRVYQTSVPIADDGTPQLYEIANIHTNQVLTVRKSQPLIGFHLVASVEWDANSYYMNDMIQALNNANNYFYDVGDGQFFLEVIELFDNGDRWVGSDLQFHARNNVLPSASLGGIDWGVSEHINVGRFWNGGSGSTGNWSLNNGFTTLIHEFGHYGFGLWDEYLDRNGQKTEDAFCASNYYETPQAERASIMNHQYDCSELCSRVDPDHQHRTQTQHDAESGGETTWETVVRRFTDIEAPSRWIVQSPDDRGTVVNGPNSIPVADWVKIYSTNHNTGACSPYTVRIYDGSTGFPAEGVEVWLARSSNLPDLQQGTTNASGKIEIFGAHNGDRLHFRKGSASGWIPVSCSTSLVATQSEVDGTIEPDPFSLDVRVVPISADMVKVQVSSSTALPASPSSSVWQDGADSPITVPLTYDAGNDHYIGEATLDNSLGATGYVYVEAANGEEQIVQKRQPFNIISIVATESNPRLYSADGNFELVLPAGSLSDNAVISIQQTTVEKDTQGNLVRVSSPYQVLLSTEQNDLNKNAIVNMRYHADKVANILTETLQLYHWSEETGQWIPDGGLVDEAFFIVSAEVEQISTFALLGQLDDVVEIYLPGVLKDFP